MYQHRMFQQREMNLQSDYVGMDAFGADASDNKMLKFDHFKKEQEEFNEILKKQQKDQMFIYKLKKYDKSLFRIMAHLVAMS